jgi:hypothetical protein
MLAKCVTRTGATIFALCAVAAGAAPVAAQQPSFPGPAAQEVFVVQTSKTREIDTSIDVFSAAASGAATPQRSIKGAQTWLGDFSRNCLAVDEAGRIYTAMYGAQAVVFEAGANGNVPFLKYWHTYDAGRMTADSSGTVEPNGTFYALFNRSPVVFLIPPNAPNRIPRFTPNLDSGAFNPEGYANGLAVDLSTNKIYVSHLEDENIGVYGPARFTVPDADRGKLLGRIKGPTTTIAWPRSVAVDVLGRVYVMNDMRNGYSSILIFNPGPDGPYGDLTPVARISGPNTKLYGGGSSSDIRVDRAGNIRVLNTTQVLTFAPGSQGDVAPTSTLDLAKSGRCLAVH